MCALYLSQETTSHSNFPPSYFLSDSYLRSYFLPVSFGSYTQQYSGLTPHSANGPAVSGIKSKLLQVKHVLSPLSHGLSLVLFFLLPPYCVCVSPVFPSWLNSHQGNKRCLLCLLIDATFVWCQVGFEADVQEGWTARSCQRHERQAGSSVFFPSACSDLMTAKL